jgi:hypothetical protein
MRLLSVWLKPSGMILPVAGFNCPMVNFGLPVQSMSADAIDERETSRTSIIYASLQ